MNSASQLVQKLWNFCNVLRDDGVSYSDYVEQLTFLLFLKIDAERRAEDEAWGTTNYISTIPEPYRWESLTRLSGLGLTTHYVALLTELGQGEGVIPTIFRRAQNRIQSPANLSRLIGLIDRETWWGLGVDVKGDIYEGLLEKNAQDVKGGAGQYFTPRPLIQAIVQVMVPRYGDTIYDPACGTGGFLLTAYDYLKSHETLTVEQEQRFSTELLTGKELVPETARLALMNLYLHNIATHNNASPIEVGDSLQKDEGDRYSIILTNPPFGKKGSYRLDDVEAESDDEENDTGNGRKKAAKRSQDRYERRDFIAATGNKQLNFLQHIYTILAENGRAAVVVPDNVLFEGGAGEDIRQHLLQNCDLHTLLRLPTGIFYAQGVKANVLFFDKKPTGRTANTETLWVYDLRTNQNFSLKQTPLGDSHLAEFIQCYHPANRHQRTATWTESNPNGRWRAYSYEELMVRDKVSLDIFWLRDESLEESSSLPAPAILAAEIVEELRSALEEFESIALELGEPL